jgi:hypothetical protein
MLRGEKSIELIDNQIISIAQSIRDHFQLPCIINNWHDGGGFKESGLRKFLSKTGAAFSQHKYGRAIDVKIEGVQYQYDDIRKEIERYWKKFSLLGLTTIESGTPTWLHLDCRHTGSNTLFIIPYTN